MQNYKTKQNLSLLCHLGPMFKHWSSFDTSYQNIWNGRSFSIYYRNLNTINEKNINPIKYYENADTQKESILKDNRHKCGIYKWTNKLNGRFYVGSSVHLSKRLINYYNYNFISNPKYKRLIEKALLKHGYSNFSLEILEYCNPSEAIVREQYYIDLLKPEYNLSPTAGSRLGSKHSEETLLKFKARKMTPEHKAKLEKHLKKINSSIEHKQRGRLRMININKLKRFSVDVLDTKTEKTTSYPSFREAAKAIGCSHTTINNAIKLFKETGINKLVKKRFLILIK